MLGLALQGGGARGAFQAGAIKALDELGVRFDGVVGTSIGALNGAMLAQHDFEKAYELWQNMEISRLFDIEDVYAKRIAALNFDYSTVKYLVSKLWETVRERGLDMTKVKRVLDYYIDEEKIRASQTDFGLVTVSFSDFKPVEIFKEDIPQGRLRDYIMASAMLPVFKNEKIDDKLYIDGGFHDNLPVNLLIDKGYTNIVAIETGSRHPGKKPKDGSVFITHIKPSEKPGRCMNFTNESVNRSMQMGYMDTMRVFKKYYGKLYYVHRLPLDVEVARLRSLPFEFYSAIGAEVGVHCTSFLDADALFAKLAVMAGKAEASPFDCFVIYLECIAKQSKIDRLKLFDFEEYVFTLKNAYNGIDPHRFTKRANELKIAKLILNYL